MNHLLKNFAKLPAAFILLLALFHNSFAQCNGKKVNIKFPDGWGPTVYVYWETQFKQFTATQNGEWYTFTLTGLSNDGAGKVEMLLTNSNGWSGGKIGRNTWNTTSDIQNTNGEKIPCNIFGNSNEIYVMENPSNAGKTLISTEPPNAKIFYLLPPGTNDYIGGIPYIMNMESLNQEPMKIDQQCGWYKKSYFDEPVPNNIMVGLGPSMRSLVTSGRIPIARKFEELGSNEIYYHADTDRWLTTRLGIPEESNRCSYNFAAVIYYKGQTGNSFSHYADQSGDAEGVCKGYVKPVLKNGKMEWNNKNGGCGNYGWANGTDFDNAFKETPGQNQQLCYDMPFQRSTSSLWEFDALYLCGDGSLDFTGTCSGSSRIGGFYLPDAVFQSAGVQKRRTYGGDFGVGPQSCFNKWCYDRGWIGGTCNNMSGGANSMGEGNLNGLTTKAQLDAEMRTFCRRPVEQGDFAGYGDWLGTMPGGSSPANVTGLLCFESHATFTYDPKQEFFFRGDDDIWVFINNQLVIDLGGNHGPAPGYVKLDTISNPIRLEEGDEYPIDIFFCDRRGPGANVRISSNIYFAQNPVNGREPGLYKQLNPAGDEICLQESANSCIALTSGGVVPPICGAELASRLSYKIYVPGWGEVPLNEGNSKCDWFSPTFGVCYGGIMLKDGIAKVIASAVTEDYLVEHGFELHAVVPGYGSLNLSKSTPVAPPPSSSSGGGTSSPGGDNSSSSDGAYSSGGEISSSSGEDTPIKTPNHKLQIITSVQYYNLKGEPLGSKKPTKSGVYIVRKNGSISKVVVR